MRPARLVLLAFALCAPAARAQGPKEFRRIFLSYLVAQGMPLADAQKLVYLPPAELESPPASAFAGSREGALGPLDDLFRKYRPSQLYTEGLKQPFEPFEDPAAPLKAKGPVTIVVLPGIFGEFIKYVPFEEFFAQQKSAFALGWQKAFAQHANPADKEDIVYSLRRMEKVNHPLTELLSVASFDGPGGKPLVKAVFLKPLFFSLETFGSIEDNTQTYLRRLGKLFNIIGAPEKFYLLGYSRSVDVALELAVAANAVEGGKPRVAWGPRIAGVISHAGVVYGTPVADAADLAGTPTHRLAAILRKLALKLEYVSEPPPPRLGNDYRKKMFSKLKRNYAAWTRAALEMAAAALHAPRPDPGLALESIKTGIPNLRSTFGLVKHILYDQYNIIAPAEELLTGKTLVTHFENMARFRIMVGKFLDGGLVMTTPHRLEWWSKHTLPAHLKLYSISATMPDAARKERRRDPHFDKRGVNRLAKDPAVVLASSVDFLSLRTNYYDIVQRTRMELNDGQVPVQRARFWPALNKKLNPRQPDHAAYYMGVLGQDHWGLAFPTAFDLKSKRVNPFPRKALLQAIATFIASTE